MDERARHKKLLAYLDKYSVATVDEFVEYLNCSPATVRRDINKLNATHKLVKIRNGAERILAPEESGLFHLKDFFPTISKINNFEEKNRIAQKAVEICQDKDNIFISEGKTTFLMGKYLTERDVQVYSNYMPLVTYLISHAFSHLVVLGGQYIRSQSLLVLPDRNIPFKGRYLFCTGDGLTETGLSKSGLLTFMEEKKLLKQVDKVVVMVDSQKMNVMGGILLASLSEIDIVITGIEADKNMVNILKENDIEIHLV